MTNKDFLCEYGQYIEVNSKEKTVRARFNEFDKETIPSAIRQIITFAITAWLNEKTLEKEIDKVTAKRIDEFIIKTIKGENQ